MDSAIGLLIVIGLSTIVGYLLRFIKDQNTSGPKPLTKDEIEQKLKEVKDAVHNNPDHVANIHDAIKRGEEIIKARGEGDQGS